MTATVDTATATAPKASRAKAPRADKIAVVAALKADTAAVGKAPGLSATTITRLLPETVTVQPGYNVRQFDPADDDDKALAASIRSQGVLTPIVVRYLEGNVVLVQGHRRLGALLHIAKNGTGIAKQWQCATIPALLARDGMTELDLIADVELSNSGKPLTPVQRGINASKYCAAGGTPKAYATIIGKTERYVRMLMVMADAPEDIRAMMDSGQVSDTLAYETMVADRADAAAVLRDALQIARKNGKDKLTLQHLNAARQARKEAAAALAIKPANDESVERVVAAGTEAGSEVTSEPAAPPVPPPAVGIGRPTAGAVAIGQPVAKVTTEATSAPSGNKFKVVGMKVIAMHDNRIVAQCNRSDDADLVMAALNEYTAGTDIH